MTNIETDRVRALAKGRPFEVIEAGWGLSRVVGAPIAFIIRTDAGGKWCSFDTRDGKVTDTQIMHLLAVIEKEHWRRQCEREAAA